MKSFLLKIVAWKLKLIAKLALKKYKPRIIGITGSVGKTSTKAAIETVLKESGENVRASGGNLNNEIGLPLAILGEYKTSGGFFFLSGAIFKGFLNVLFGSKKKYPKTLVLEYAADHPGDIEYLTKIAKPDVAVVTAIGKTPVHVEFYDSVSQVAAEKSKLVKALKEDGTAILNGDDPMVLAMKDVSKGGVMTYGFKDTNDLKISNIETAFSDGFPNGMKFSLESPSGGGEVSIKEIIGKAPAYSIAAAVATALAADIDFDKALKSASKYTGEKGRGHLIPGIKDSLILDDSYNAAPESTSNALEAIKHIDKKKIVVLGDMLELGSHSDQAHEEIGRFAGGIADILVAIGPQAEVFAKAAANNRIRKENIYTFKTSDDAVSKIKELIEGGELILVKGSQSIRTEKIVKAVMKNPDDARELLVRQYGKWLRS